MNDAVRAAINARMKEKEMSRADLARAVEKTPQEISRALNGTKGGGTIPPLWAAMLDALGLTLTAVPVEHLSTGQALTLPADPQQLDALAHRVAQVLREAVTVSTPSPAAPAEQLDEPGSAEGES